MSSNRGITRGESQCCRKQASTDDSVLWNRSFRRTYGDNQAIWSSARNEGSAGVSRFRAHTRVRVREVLGEPKSRLPFGIGQVQLTYQPSGVLTIETTRGMVTKVLWY